MHTNYEQILNKKRGNTTPAPEQDYEEREEYDVSHIFYFYEKLIVIFQEFVGAEVVNGGNWISEIPRVRPWAVRQDTSDNLHLIN